jgi:hypothetical protein
MTPLSAYPPRKPSRQQSATNLEQRAFLSLPRYPAFLTLLQTCWLLGLVYHQGEILVRRGILFPAGKRRTRKARMFATSYVLALAEDRDWLSKARDSLSLHWEQQRKAKRARQAKQSNVYHTKLSH